MTKSKLENEIEEIIKREFDSVDPREIIALTNAIAALVRKKQRDFAEFIYRENYESKAEGWYDPYYRNSEGNFQDKYFTTADLLTKMESENIERK